MSGLIKRGDMVWNSGWIGVVTDGQSRPGATCLVLWWSPKFNESLILKQRDETCLTVFGSIEEFGVDLDGSW